MDSFLKAIYLTIVKCVKTLAENPENKGSKAFFFKKSFWMKVERVCEF